MMQSVDYGALTRTQKAYDTLLESQLHKSTRRPASAPTRKQERKVVYGSEVLAHWLDKHSKDTVLASTFTKHKRR